MNQAQWGLMVKLFIKLSQFLFKIGLFDKGGKGKKRKERGKEEEKKHEMEGGRSKGDMKTGANSS